MPHSAVRNKIKGAISTHDCPECTGPAYCAMADGKSSNLCWCMTVDKPYTPDTQYESCMCKRCLTTPKK